MPDEAALDRWAQAAWKLRCDRMAEAKERPPAVETWEERAPFLQEIDRSVVSLIAAMAVHDAGVQVAEAGGRLIAVTAERDQLAREVAKLRAEIREHGGWPEVPVRDYGVES
jgi:hypothetical protein